MPYIWDESMSTDISRLDKQHQMLIQKFNEFTEILDNSTEARETTEDVLDFLQFYATWHFKQEEDCMEQYHCPVAAANKQAHKEFLAQFGDLYQHWQNSTMDAETTRRVHLHLADWIVNHIINIDTRLKPCAPHVK
jgi:hemerythrin